MSKEKECIPVGCVAPALYRTGGSLSRRSLLGSLPPPPHHHVDRQTPVKLLPCPKLRLRAVITGLSRVLFQTKANIR